MSLAAFPQQDVAREFIVSLSFAFGVDLAHTEELV